jgi:hypothetical protein|tara:strand:- start:225 stop:605 length:381 start_codon:yes stop_codon:yes gene_type:complete
MNDYGRTKFKLFAKMNRLRMQRAEDGNPVVVSRGKKYAGTMLYDGFSDEFIGLCVVRDSPSKLSHTAGKLNKMGLTPWSCGDYEAIYKVPYDKVWEIAKMFNMVKKRPSNQNVDGLREYRRKKAAS